MFINNGKEQLHNTWTLSSYRQHNPYEITFVKNNCRVMVNADILKYSAADLVDQINPVNSLERCCKEVFNKNKMHC